MLLRDLHTLHGRLVDQRLMLPEGFKPTRVQLLVDLNLNGEVRTATRPADDRGRPLMRVIPDLPRSVGVDPLLIADKLGYVAGLAAPARRARATAQWLAYRALLEECATAVSPGLAARIEAVSKATVDPVAFVDALNRHLRDPDEKVDQRGIAPIEAGTELPAEDVKHLNEQAQWLVDFTVDGERFFPSVLHDHDGDPECVSWWSERAGAHSTSDRVGLCQVTNVRAPLARLVPAVGELPGNSPRLVSCNFDAAERYGAQQSNGAAISTSAASRATQALKWLAGEAQESHRWNLDELVLVWWCPEDLRFNPLKVLQVHDPMEVRDLLAKDLWAGRPQVTERSGFHLAVLSVNSARIVVRADHTTTLDVLQERLREWFAGLQPVRDRVPQARLGLPELARAACAPGRNQAAARARVTTDLVRRALLGERLPTSLLNRVVRRCHVGVVDRQGRRRHVTAAQAALLHAIAHSWEVDWMSGSQGELCGRLLAVLEATQQKALGKGLNRGVQASYGAASTTPRLVFPRLVQRQTAHLRKLQRNEDGRRKVGWLERHMKQVAADLQAAGGFPAHLNPAEKAEFALGYWHQRYVMDLPAKGAATTDAAGPAADPAADPTDGHDLPGDDRDMEADDE